MSIQIIKEENIPESLIISKFKYDSILTSDYQHIFYILKSYTNNNQGLVRSLYFVLNNNIGNNKPEYVLNIRMNEVNILKDDENFLNWWEKIVMRLHDYETNEKKINILIHLNKKNIILKFDLKNEENWKYIQPIKYKKQFFFKKYIKNIIFVLSIILNIFFLFF